eukprot:m.102824 g.102824  ORF g.102824 m.102824 type:complete len:175 (-) comp22364_c0_seq1:30-554(-)
MKIYLLGLFYYTFSAYNLLFSPLVLLVLQLKEEFPDEQFYELNKKLSDLWRQLPEDERQRYEAIAAEEKRIEEEQGDSSDEDKPKTPMRSPRAPTKEQTSISSPLGAFRPAKPKPLQEVHSQQQQKLQPQPQQPHSPSPAPLPHHQPVSDEQLPQEPLPPPIRPVFSPTTTEAS